MLVGGHGAHGPSVPQAVPGMGCVHCKEKGSSKGQAGGELGAPPPTASQYDPDPTQPGAAFTRIPDFNNFHGATVPSAPSFAGPGGFTPNSLQMRSGGITGQQGLEGVWLHPCSFGGNRGLIAVPSTCRRWGRDALHRPVRLRGQDRG